LKNWARSSRCVHVMRARGTSAGPLGTGSCKCTIPAGYDSRRLLNGISQNLSKMTLPPPRYMAHRFVHRVPLSLSIHRTPHAPTAQRLRLMIWSRYWYGPRRMAPRGCRPHGSGIAGVAWASRRDRAVSCACAIQRDGTVRQASRRLAGMMAPYGRPRGD
jgi:hypothetical protein